MLERQKSSPATRQYFGKHPRVAAKTPGWLKPEIKSKSARDHLQLDPG